MNKSVIGVCGAGAMGSGIAQVAATAGHKVIVYDSFEGTIERSQKNIHAGLDKLVEKQKITTEKSTDIKANLTFTKSLADLKPAGMVIEAIVEDLGSKKKLFVELEALVSAECILASNTSSLSIASLSSACKKQDRVIGIHFFNPATLMPLVEIIPGITTSAHTLTFSRDLIDSWGKTTVMCKDTPGFIVNRVARSYYGESIRIYEEGWEGLPDGPVGMATIDWAMKTFGGFKMGPFELMDFIGSDINYKVTESVWEQFFYDQRFKPSLTQKRLYEAGWYGRKSGRGYYDYREGAQMPRPHEDEILGKAIFNRVICMLINEAFDTVYLKVATVDDVETAMMKGVNYPKGLIAWGKELGLKHVVATLDQLYALYGEDRYRVSVGLRKHRIE
ncbi:MAG TPA: 3-hydroxyacyl-CoA dehydrogenase NAD-binding domain-containing protein [Flavobacteriales bacterium]|nr:3-hydroxyacyl-CoA dehydrogenase NAD-binding domain-containing protein [Flavobacteriales bacterium]